MSETSSPLFTPPDSPQLPSSVDVDVASFDEGPDIPGLFYFPNFIPSTEAESIVEDIIHEEYFDVEGGRDQAVLFGSRETDQTKTLPQWTIRLLTMAQKRLREGCLIPDKTAELLFPTSNRCPIDGNVSYTRQLILNCYRPGQGIASHVDLADKFLDGIMIFSFGSGITMTFQKMQDETLKHSVYLQPCSLCVLSDESRWKWSHGIPQREFDWVWNKDRREKEYRKRGLRLSITIRWYKLEQ